MEIGRYNMVTFQQRGFEEDYKNVLEGKQYKGLYIDPDTVANMSMATPFYNMFTEFLNKREQSYEKKFIFLPPKKAKLTTNEEIGEHELDCTKITVLSDGEVIFRMTSDQFGFSAGEGIYKSHDDSFESSLDKCYKYPLSKINCLSRRNKNSQQRQYIINKLINYVKYTRTLGGAFVWPLNKDGNRNSEYNRDRGILYHLEDRVDLTLLEIKHALDGEYDKGKYTYDKLFKLYKKDTNRIRTWLSHFKSFDEYVKYFRFDNFVKQGMPINIITGDTLCEDDYKNVEIREIQNLELDKLLCMIERLEIMIVERTRRMEEDIKDYMEKCNIK